MVIVYMVIICLSAALASWAGLRVVRRVAPLVNLRPAIGWCAALPSLAFLMVISAPPPVLTGALLLGLILQVLPLRLQHTAIQITLIVAMLLIGLSGFHAPVAPRLAAIPAWGLYAGMGVVWLITTAAAIFASDRAGVFSSGALAALAAVAVASIWLRPDFSLAYDAAIMGCALAGLLLGGGMRLPFGLPARLVMGMLIGYMALSAIWQGAWMAGAASLLIWLGAAGWNWASADPGKLRHA